MSNVIAPVSAGVDHATPQGSDVPLPGAVARPARDPRTEKLLHAATEFESLLVKQLLKAAKLGGTGGDEKASGYADMAVDALATAVERGGGLGLARRIQEAIGHPGTQGAAKPHNGGGG
jgi:Rod binding domain-containing protein